MSATSAELDPDATFAFVDLAGFTAVTDAHGDREAVEILRGFRRRVEACLGPNDELVKTIGDAVMLRFETPTDAVAGLWNVLQQEVGAPDAVLVPRAGAHHGRAVAVDGDYYGAAVNLASRVAGQARPGQLLVTGEVAAAAHAAGAVTNHLGRRALRNMSEPVDLWDVGFGLPGAAIAVDPVCHMRVVAGTESAIALDWHGERFHFCGLPCVSRFATSPDAFRQPPAEP